MQRTFLDSEGEYRVPGALALALLLLLVIVFLEVIGEAHIALYLAFVWALGYVAGERRRSSPASEVEPVAPPYIPSDDEV